MRTDSTRISNDALGQVRDLIGVRFGASYLPEKPNAFTTKAKGAQEAHEAIRPTEVVRTPDELAPALSPDQLKLYKLIWEKFVASQMKPAVYKVTTATFEAALPGFRAENKVSERFEGPARFIAQGEVEVFDGHRAGSPRKRASGRRRRCRSAWRSGAPIARAPWSRPSTSPSRRRASARPRW